MPCSLCPAAGAQQRQLGNQTAYQVECPLCGQYEITWMLDEDIRDNLATFTPLLPALRAHTRQESVQGRVPRLTTDNYAALAAGHRETSVPTKLRRILEFMERESKVPGDSVTFNDAHPLFEVDEPGHLHFLLTALAERNLVRFDGPLGGHERWSLTADGWEYLMPAAADGVAGTVFVAYAYTIEMHAVYNAGMRPAIEEDCRLSVTNVSEVQQNGSITDVILAGIRGAQVVVADVTHQRNGVYFEGGFGMGLGRQVIWMCRHDDVANIHFDTRNYNHILWHDAADLRRKLADRLRATVSVPARP